MRLIWQGFGLGLVALVCFVASGVEFWQEVSFGNRAVEVQAKVTDRHSHLRQGPSYSFARARYTLTLGFVLAGQQHQVSPQVSMASYLSHGIGDAITIRVDPDQPTVVEIDGDEFATMGLYLGIAGFGALALSVLSFGTAYAGLLKRAEV